MATDAKVRKVTQLPATRHSGRRYGSSSLRDIGHDPLRIFVSHAHEDNVWCRTFVHLLHHAGADVWYDEQNFGHGVIVDEIERELKARPIFIVVLSPTSVLKPWVRREVEAAMSLRDNDAERVILPVAAKMAEVPLLWRGYKQVSGPHGAGLTAAQAARRVVDALAAKAPVRQKMVSLPVDMPVTAGFALAHGIGLLAQGRTERALAAFEWAHALDPQWSMAWHFKGIALVMLGRGDEAQAAYEQARSLEVQDAVAWAGKTRVLWGLDHCRGAEGNAG